MSLGREAESAIWSSEVSSSARLRGASRGKMSDGLPSTVVAWVITRRTLSMTVREVGCQAHGVARGRRSVDRNALQQVPDVQVVGREEAEAVLAGDRPRGGRGSPAAPGNGRSSAGLPPVGPGVEYWEAARPPSLTGGNPPGGARPSSARSSTRGS